MQNLVEIGQNVPELLKILVNPKWRPCRHFGSSSKVKTPREHIYSLNATTCKIWYKSVKSYRRYGMILYPYALSLSFSIGKKTIFNPVVWVGVWFWMNGTCLIPRPLCYLPGHIFRFFVSCTGPEEIVPESTRGSDRNNNNKKNKTEQKKKSREI